MHTSKLDLVLPCFNPIVHWETNLLKSVARIQELLPDTELYVYLVNDGSTKAVDPEKIAKLQSGLSQFQYVSYPENHGKGYALRTGMAETKNDLCIYTDIDFPYTEDSFVAIYRALTGNKPCDIAVGVRDENYYATVPPARVKISKTLRFFAKKLLTLPVDDTQAGLKGFNRKGREIFLQTQINRYLFDLEFIRKAARQKTVSIKPVKVQLKPGIVFSVMNPKILLTESWNLLRAWLN
jgi:glycosyltransferase involved in cell wall biosynthesis